MIMGSALRILRTFTDEEYLAIERKAKDKSELIAGHIYAMAGASPTHAAITANVIVAFGSQLKGKPCTVYTNDLKVKIGRGGDYYYPGLTIVCGQPIFHDEHQGILVNPTVIVEVLSPSTEADDRGRKWLRYQQIQGLTDYLMVSQSEPLLEHYKRQANGSWQYESCAEHAEALTILDCRLLLADVYEKVNFAA
jgi:Uma2 family endonuclease